MKNKEPINIEGEYWDAKQVLKNPQDYHEQTVIDAQNFCRGYEYALQSIHDSRPFKQANEVSEITEAESKKYLDEMFWDDSKPIKPVNYKEVCQQVDKVVSQNYESVKEVGEIRNLAESVYPHDIGYKVSFNDGYYIGFESAYNLLQSQPSMPSDEEIEDEARDRVHAMQDSLNTRPVQANEVRERVKHCPECAHAPYDPKYCNCCGEHNNYESKPIEPEKGETKW